MVSALSLEKIPNAQLASFAGKGQTECLLTESLQPCFASKLPHSKNIIMFGFIILAHVQLAFSKRLEEDSLLLAH